MNKEYNGEINAISSSELMKDTDLMNKMMSLVTRVYDADDAELFYQEIAETPDIVIVYMTLDDVVIGIVLQVTQGESGVGHHGVDTHSTAEADAVGRGGVYLRPSEGGAGGGNVLHRQHIWGQDTVADKDLNVVDGYAVIAIGAGPTQGYTGTHRGGGAEVHCVAEVAGGLRGQGVDRIERVKRFVVVAHCEDALVCVFMPMVNAQRESAQLCIETRQENGGCGAHGRWGTSHHKEGMSGNVANK